MSALRLSMRGIRKRFGSTQALDGVDFELRAGEIHALIGENGAGKSTLMKILSGAEKPDEGSIVVDGQSLALRSPHDARRAGIAMVYQELTLAPDLDVHANIFLGQEGSYFGFLQPNVDRRRAERILEILEHPEIRFDTPVAQLSAAACQLVEIGRALVGDIRILVLDEPTSALTRDDVERLFRLIRRLRDRGVTVVYISHYLEEIDAVAERFTVLRDGRHVDGGEAGQVAHDRIIEMMVGRRLEEQYPKLDRKIGPPVLEVADVAGVKMPRGVTFTLRRGEILGLAGIMGAGRTETLRALFGLDEVKRGTVSYQFDARPKSPAQRINEGMGMLSEDRKLEGLALDQSIADNLTYSWLRPYSWFGLIREGSRRQMVRQWLVKLGVRCRGGDQPVGELSGGNQQKIALGRLLHQQAEVLLLDEPTRGVDVASKAEIYRLIGELAVQGKAILIVSSYLPELFGICDTLAVMTRGRLSPVRPVAEWTAEQVMAYATGAEVSAGVPA